MRSQVTARKERSTKGELLERKRERFLCGEAKPLRICTSYEAISCGGEDER